MKTEKHDCPSCRKMRSTLQVIMTWATFQGGRALVPKHVEELIRKTLSETESWKPPQI